MAGFDNPGPSSVRPYRRQVRFAAGRWPVLDRRTSDLRYVRLHGDRELYASGYTPAALDAWAERCQAWMAGGEDVVVYFDNDAKGYAPHDAIGLLERLDWTAKDLVGL